MKFPSRSSCQLLIVYLFILFGGSSCVLNCDGNDSSSEKPRNYPISLAISPHGSAILIGETQKFTIMGDFGAGVVRDITSEVAWTVNEPSIASVDQNGTVTGIGVGEVIVTAKWDEQNFFTSTALLVTESPVTGLDISPREAEVPTKSQLVYVVTATLRDGSSMDVTLAAHLSSNNSYIARPVYTTPPNPSSLIRNRGIVVSRGRGQCEITAQLDGLTAKAKLTVLAPLSNLDIVPATAEVTIGTTQKLQAIATLEDLTMLDVTNLCSWSSSNAGTVTVPSTTVTGYAVATGLRLGQATVTARLNLQSASYRTSSTELTVVPVSSSSTLSITPGESLSAPGSKRQFQAIMTKSDGSTQDVTDQVTWSSNNGKVVVANDNVSPNKKGLALIDPTIASGQMVRIEAAFGPLSSSSTLHIGAFAYVANHADGDLSVFEISSLGTLLGGSRTQTGSGPSGIAVDPTGRFVYVANEYDDSISMFEIDPSNGALSNGATVNAGDAPTAITVDPSGRFVYVANFNNSKISRFEIDPSDGHLQGETVTDTGDQPQALIVEPRGRFLYVANTYGNSLSVFEIDAESGQLTLKSNMESETWPRALAVEPTGNILYVTYEGSSEVASFRINQTTGALTELTRKPVGSGPLSIAIDATGSFAYVASIGTSIVTLFDINSDGMLPDGFVTASGLNAASTVVTDPSGRFVYVVGYDGVTAFSNQATTGILTTLLGTIPAGGDAFGMTTTP